MRTTPRHRDTIITALVKSRAAWQYARMPIELVSGDITTQPVDAIVNAANSALCGGGGVDGAIHRRAGPDLAHELRERYAHGCATGQAVLTRAYQLPARFVIHAVGPVWRGGTENEAALLASAYYAAFLLAEHNGCHSIAFPSISTGAYGYPVAQAAPIALGVAREFAIERHYDPLVRFVLFDPQTLAAFAQAWEVLKA